MHELLELAVELQSFCLHRGWKFCFIGGQKDEKLKRLGVMNRRG